MNGNFRTEKIKHNVDGDESDHENNNNNNNNNEEDM
jgi:hypothetical protein